MHDHNHHDAAATHHVDFESPHMVAHAELEGEVFGGLTMQAVGVLAQKHAAGGGAVRRLLDLGSGPGVGTCVLAERFASAHVVAVDGSAAMLARVTERAERLGLASRVETRQVELADDLAALGQADVVWASLALHHIGDEAAALRGIHGCLRPGGLLALVEIGEPLRLEGRDAHLGRPGLWERLDMASVAWFADMRAGLPGTTASTDYPTMLGATGFEVLVDELLTFVLDPPLDAQARQLARRHLEQTRARLANHAAQPDLDALDELLDADSEHSITGRDDIAMRISRRLFIARA